MSELILREPLAEVLRALAKQQNSTPESIVELLVERFDFPDEELPPRPVTSLKDSDIALPSDLINADAAVKAAYRQAVRAAAPKLYRIARRYWLKQGDLEHLALTDEELDQKFWLIDHEGIPRFKTEKDRIQLPADPLENLLHSLDVIEK